MRTEQGWQLLFLFFFLVPFLTVKLKVSSPGGLWTSTSEWFTFNERGPLGKFKRVIELHSRSARSIFVDSSSVNKDRSLNKTPPGQKVWSACPEFSAAPWADAAQSTAGRPGRADAPGRGAGGRAQRLWEKPQCFHSESLIHNEWTNSRLFKNQKLLRRSADLPRACKGATHRAELDSALVPVKE